MKTLTSFDLVPSSPFNTEELSAIRAKLESYPTYYESAEDLYVLFGSGEERKETVALYIRSTVPTYDGDCVVQVRPNRLRIHPGGQSAGVTHLREFVTWALNRKPCRLLRAGAAENLDTLLPPTDLA